MDELEEITMRVKTNGRLDEEELKLLQNLQKRLTGDVNQLTEQINALTTIRGERQLQLDATTCLLKPATPSVSEPAASTTAEHQGKFTRKEKDAAITKAIEAVAKPFTSTGIREYLAEYNPATLQVFGKTYIANNLAKREKKGQIKRVGDTKDGYAIKYIISK